MPSVGLSESGQKMVTFREVQQTNSVLRVTFWHYPATGFQPWRCLFSKETGEQIDIPPNFVAKPPILNLPFKSVKIQLILAGSDLLLEPGSIWGKWQKRHFLFSFEFIKHMKLLEFHRKRSNIFITGFKKKFKMSKFSVSKILTRSSSICGCRSVYCYLKVTV